MVDEHEESVAGGEGCEGSVGREGVGGEGAALPAEREHDEVVEGSVGRREPPSGEPLSLRTLNQMASGDLVLHYPGRDVAVRLDGDSAMRLMAMFARRQHHAQADVLDAEESSARSGWLVLDLDEVLAMSWEPAAREPDRTAIDPPLLPR